MLQKLKCFFGWHKYKPYKICDGDNHYHFYSICKCGDMGVIREKKIMSQSKAREFWIDETESGFDLNWSRRWVAEFPHKDTLAEPTIIKVIEYSAYEQLKSDYDKLKEENQRISDENLKCEQDIFLYRETVKQREIDLKILKEKNAILREALEIIRDQADFHDNPFASDLAKKALADLEGGW